MTGRATPRWVMTICDPLSRSMVKAVGSEYAQLNAPLSGLELRCQRQGEREYAPCGAYSVQAIQGLGRAQSDGLSAPDRVDRADSTTPGRAPVLQRDCEPRRLRWVPGCRHPAAGSKRCSPHCPGGSPRARIVRNGSGQTSAEAPFRRFHIPRLARAATCKRGRMTSPVHVRTAFIRSVRGCGSDRQHVELSPCLAGRAVRSIRVRRRSCPATTPCGAGRLSGDGTSRRWCEPPRGTSGWSGRAAGPGAGCGGCRSRTRRRAAD